MKADLHVHSCYSEDGHSKPQEIVDAAVARGIGCIAVTDHNEFRAHLEMDDDRVIIIPAEEVSSKKGHILAYGIDRFIPRDMGVVETIDAIHEAGGIAIAAHPYRYHSGLGEENIVPEFDGVEALNGRSKKKDNARSRKLSEEFGPITTVGSDAHTPDRIGDSWIVVPDSCRTWEDVVEAIKGGLTEMYSVDRTLWRTFKYVVKSVTMWFLRGFRRM